VACFFFFFFFLIIKIGAVSERSTSKIVPNLFLVLPRRIRISRTGDSEKVCIYISKGYDDIGMGDHISISISIILLLPRCSSLQRP
jgi:hypothetical protein